MTKPEPAPPKEPQFDDVLKRMLKSPPKQYKDGKEKPAKTGQKRST